MELRSTARLRARPEQKTSSFSPTVSFLLSLFFLGLSGLLVINMVKSVSTAYQRNLLLVQAEQEVYDLRLRNLELMEKMDYVSSSSYIEQEARDQLQYVKEGETMVLLPDTGEDDSAVLGEQKENKNEDQNPELIEQEKGWNRWLDLLKYGV